MNLDSYRQLPIGPFLGLYDRGADEEVPPSHFRDSNNIEHFPSSFRTRKGTSSRYVFTGGTTRTRYFEFSNGSSSAPFIFSIDASGNFYKDASLLGSFPGANDFGAVQFFNKLFITFHDNNVGVGVVYMWDNEHTTFRACGGITPAGSVMIATTVTTDGLYDGSVAVAGTTYAVGNIINVGVGGAQIVITLVDPSTGAVLDFDILSNGSGYVYGSTYATSGGGDNALQIKVVGVGNIQLGKYQFAVAYEYDTGYITPPGPISGSFAPTIWISQGGVQVTLSNVPVSPSPHVIARFLLATHGDGTEFFFVEDKDGGIIHDNVSTSATLNFFDTDLIESADYLFNVRESIPCGTGINIYSARLCVFGFESPDESLLRLSQAADPETFDQTVENIVVFKDDGYKIKNGVQVRDLWYIFKDVGIYVTSDNGDDPSGWDVFLVDKAIGTNIHGISTVSATSMVGSHNDIVLIADKSGLYMFNGMVNYPEISWKIKNIWDTKIDFSKVDPFIDVVNKRVYILGTTDGTIVYGDYTEGVTFDKIKWSIWELPNNVTCAAILDSSSGGSPEFTFLETGLGVYKFDSTQALDHDATAIDSFATFGKNTFMDGWINIFVCAKLRVTGQGQAKCFLIGYDALDDVNNPNQMDLRLENFPLADNPKREIQLFSRFMSEEAYLRIRNNIDETPQSNFWVSKIMLFGKPLYPTRPQASN